MSWKLSASQYHKDASSEIKPRALVVSTCSPRFCFASSAPLCFALLWPVNACAHTALHKCTGGSCLATTRKKKKTEDPQQHR